MTINQRLNCFFEYTKLDAPEFYKRIGVDRIEWSGWINSAKPISVMKLQRIIMGFPELNARWLMVGDGEMIIVSDLDQEALKANDNIEKPRLADESKASTYPCPNCAQKDKFIEVLNEMIDSKQETIDSQKVAIESLKHLLATLQGDERKNANKNCG